MSKLIPYMFYKNIAYAMCQFWFSILYAAWSGQKFYIEAGNTTVDVIYTGLPIIMLSVLDQVRFCCLVAWLSGCLVVWLSGFSNPLCRAGLE